VRPLLAGLAEACGSTGMVGGQVLDLDAEGSPPDRATLEEIHSRKTGALIRAAVEVGGVCAGATPDALRALTAYGRDVGLAFQIVDDILDEVGTTAELGKSPGKDRGAGKLTFPALLGIEASRREADRLLEDAIHALAPLGPAALPLEEVARFVGARRS
jgi:geranylgeranyl diphosphate synthase type II